MHLIVQMYRVQGATLLEILREDYLQRPWPKSHQFFSVDLAKGETQDFLQLAFYPLENRVMEPLGLYLAAWADSWEPYSP